MNVLLLNPLLTKLDEEVTGLRLDNEAQKVVVTAYADYVTIILTGPTDIPLLQNILYTYEQATGAKTKGGGGPKPNSGGSGTRTVMCWVSSMSLKKGF